jgi:hypothetical protein
LNKLVKENENSDGSVVRPTQISHSAFLFLLEWIYTASIEITEISLDIALEIYTKAEYYELPILKNFVEGVIKANIDITTARTVFDMALKTGASKIVDFCSLFICKNFSKIMKHSASVASSEAMDEEKKSSPAKGASLFSKDELAEITKNLSITELPAPVYKSELVPVSQETPKQGNPKSEIKKETASKSKSAASTPNTKSESSQKPQTQRNRQEKAQKEDPPPEHISPKNLDLIKKLLQDLFDQEIATEFREPVPKDYPLYAQLIKNPMDLGTIRRNLSGQTKKKYKLITDLASDVRLVFNNARTFNLTDSLIYQFAEQLNKQFEDAYTSLKNKLNLPKTFDLPKVFIPPENMNNMVVEAPTALPPSRERSRKKSLDTSSKDDNFSPSSSTSSNKKRKVEKKSEPKPNKQKIQTPPSEEPVTQAEVESLTSDLSKILHIHEVALEIITIAYEGNTGGEEEYELDVSTLPPSSIRKLQLFVSDYKKKNPSAFMDTMDDDQK